MTATKAVSKEVRPATQADSPKRCKVIEPTFKLPPTSEMAGFDSEDWALARSLLNDPLEFVDHALFRKPTVEKFLFGSKASLLPYKSIFASEEQPAAIEGQLTQGVTLTTTQEILLFQRFNYARMRVFKMAEAYANKDMTVNALRQMLAWTRRTQVARETIAQANLPLVLAMAKRTRLAGLDFNELISEGNYALLRSIDKFDCSRGFKFSTYACRAILKSFSRVAMRTNRYRGRFPTEFDPTLEKSDLVDRKHDAAESDCVDEIRSIFEQNRAHLNDTERTVIRERFALNAPCLPAKPKTLEQVGAMIGVTKERVRQIQNKALLKLRSSLEENFLAN